MNSRTIMVALLATSMLASPAFAQEKDKVGLDEIVVTAQKRSENVQDVPIAITAITGEQLESKGIRSLDEVAFRVPNLSFRNTSDIKLSPISLRGVIASTGSAGQDPSVATYVDEVFLGAGAGANIAYYDLEAVEVLRGPQGTLFGRNAIGGVINIVDGRIAERTLDETFKGRAELRYDNVNRGRTAMARVDASGADGALVLHADGVYRDQDDYDTPDGEQSNSFVETRTGGLGASYIGVSLDMLQNRFELKTGINRDVWIFDGLRGSFANTHYEHTEFEGAEVGTVFTNEANEGRLELTHRAFGNWTGAVGFQAGERTFEAIGEEAFVPRTKTRSQGLFWMEHGQWDALQVDLGVRTDRVRSDAAGQPRRTFTPLSLSAGALWRFSDAWRVTVNLDRAERAPAEEELFADGPHVASASYEIGDSTFSEERANQVEMGLHYHGARFEAKASIYATRFDGFIYLAETGTFTPPEPGEDPLPIRQWSQADASFRGVEAEVTAHLLDNARGKLDLRAFGDHVRGELDSGAVGTDKDLPRIAPSRFGLDLNWSTDRWRAALGATRVMRQDDVAADESETAGYTLVDAHFAWHWDTDDYGWEVFVDANNLGDVDARVHTSFLKDNVVLPGRNFGLGVRLFF